ncbi:MAG: alpha/beta hydrolase [Pseudomonadota bacterium]
MEPNKGLSQTLRVLAMRRFYRFISAWGWRRWTSPITFTDVRIPCEPLSVGTRLYSPQQSEDKPLIVYIHGGGWVMGDLETHHSFCLALGEASACNVIALDYRLAPEHAFPAAHDDCLAATSWLVDHARDLVPCNGKLIIAGDSAGGNLATCTTLELEAERREKVLGQLLIYPATDHYSVGTGSYVIKAKGQLLTSSMMLWFWDTYLGGAGSTEPMTERAFPARSEHLAEQPPTMVITAEGDPLRDEGKLYAEALEKAGVATTYHHFANAAHGFACSDGPTADHVLLMNQFKAWLQTVTA